MSKSLRARHVLEDCRAALDELQKTDDLDVYRRRWVTLVTLIRAVGHVLDKEDGKQSPEYARIIAEHWDKDKPEIFSTFIEDVRGSTIKQYRSGALLLSDPSCSPMAFYDASAMNVAESGVKPLTAMSVKEMAADIGAPLPFYFGDGPFKDELVYEVIAEAIAFWEDYLTSIETEVGAAQG